MELSLIILGLFKMNNIRNIVKDAYTLLGAVFNKFSQGIRFRLPRIKRKMIYKSKANLRRNRNLPGSHIKTIRGLCHYEGHKKIVV